MMRVDPSKLVDLDEALGATRARVSTRGYREFLESIPRGKAYREEFGSRKEARAFLQRMRNAGHKFAIEVHAALKADGDRYIVYLWTGKQG